MCIGGAPKAPYQPATPVAPDTGALLTAMQRQQGNVGGIGSTLMTGGQGVTASAPTALPMATKSLIGA